MEEISLLQTPPASPTMGIKAPRGELCWAASPRWEVGEWEMPGGIPGHFLHLLK